MVYERDLNPRKGLIAQLDGLRGLAALIVVVSHYSNETLLWGGVLGKGGGQTGVMLFFLLSGFLMAHLHLGEAFTARNVGRYALRRIARVYPLFLIAAALPPTLLALHFRGGVAMNTVNSYVLYLRQVALIDRGALVFWTIRVELLFYAVFIAIWLLHRLSLRYLSGAWGTAGALILWLSYLRIEDYDFRIEFFQHVHYFLFGVLSALAWRRRESFRNAAVSISGLALVAALPLTYPMVWLHLGHGPIPASNLLMASWRSDGVALLLITFFQLLLRDRLWLFGLLASKPFRWLGKVSYSTYLLHYFVLSALLSWIPPAAGNLVRFTSCMVVVLIVSCLSHRWVEKPLQNLVLRLPELLRSSGLRKPERAQAAA